MKFHHIILLGLFLSPCAFASSAEGRYDAQIRDLNREITLAQAQLDLASVPKNQAYEQMRAALDERDKISREALEPDTPVLRRLIIEDEKVGCNNTFDSSYEKYIEPVSAQALVQLAEHVGYLQRQLAFYTALNHEQSKVVARTHVKPLMPSTRIRATPQLVDIRALAAAAMAAPQSTAHRPTTIDYQDMANPDQSSSDQPKRSSCCLCFWKK